MTEEVTVEFARAIQGAGGRVLEAGGAVRDRLLGRPPRDADLEVYGLPPDALEQVIARFGPVHKVGARLGVYVLRGVEIALPQGPGGVEDPFLPPEQAARRRDLTVNALLRDPLSGEMLDFFGGERDLDRRRLRHVDPQTFAEDPLRLLRVVRLHAELGFAVEPSTAALCRGLTLAGAAWERIGRELERWLLGALRPGRGLDALIYCGAEREFPGLRRLLGCPMPPGWDADAWGQTRAVLNTAAARCPGERSRDWPLMLAALLQSGGRPDVTRLRAGRTRSPGHAGVAATRVPLFLGGVDQGRALARTVAALVETQGAVEGLAARGAGRPAYRRLARAVDSDLLLRLAGAIHAGRRGEGSPFPAGEVARAIWREEDLLGKAPRPLLRGGDLAGLGVEPGPAMGRWLEAAFQAQLDGAFADREGARAWLARALGRRSD